jgi:HD-like signal output (HDOD) protein
MLNIPPLDQELLRKLPSPNGVALAIMQACNREDVSIAEVALLIKGDPVLTGRLLELANSTSMGGRPVASVEAAVGRLGLRAICQLALSFSLIDQHSTGYCYAFDYPEFWIHSLLMAIAMGELAALRRIGAADELFTCGLLAQVGCLAFATAYPTEYGHILLSGTQGASILQLERDQLHMDHVQMSAALMQKWGIPTVFIESVMLLETELGTVSDVDLRVSQVAQVMHHGRCVADYLCKPAHRETGDILDIQTVTSQLGLETSEFNEMVERIVEQWMRFPLSNKSAIPSSTQRING